MAAQAARLTWLDDFRGDVSSRFDSVDRRFDSVDRRFDSVDRRLDRIDNLIDELTRTLLVIGGGIAASILVGAAGIIATQL